MNAAPGGTEPGAAFDWDGAMHAGLGLLRFGPRDFWAMTPRELAAALGAFARVSVAPGRAELEALMRRFPDG